MPMAELFV